MSNKVRSYEYVIEFSGTTVAAGTSYSLEINNEEIDVSTLDSGAWRELESGLKTWSGSFDGMVERGVGSAFYTLVEQILSENNAPVTVALKATVSGDKYLTGTALLTNISKSGSGAGGQEVVTWSGSFSGSGALTLDTLA